MRSSGHRATRFATPALLCVIALAGPLGCGGGDPPLPPEPTQEYTSAPTAAPTVEPVDSDACPGGTSEVGSTNTGYDAWLQVCASDVRDYVQIRNESGNSFVAWATNEDTTLNMTAVPSTQTLAGYLASEAVPPGDPDLNGEWVLTPDSTLVASSAGPAGVAYQVSATYTAGYNAAHSSGEAFDGLAVTRSQALFRKGATCFENAAEATKEQPQLDLALGALKVRTACKGFLDDVLRESGGTVDETPQSVWRRFLDAARRLAGGNWDDELAYGIARVLRP